ncbi:MAG: RsmE family RNA methyltransferase [Saprospiraceae bacterium]|nr:RsmE family RNA methyltransferase [Saprospiraceae bacterium]
MQLFYTNRIENGLAILDEEESRHALLVLRHRPGDVLHLTDGRGNRFTAELMEAGKKQAMLRILEQHPGLPAPPFWLHVGIAPPKHIDRLEWFVEKATELGVSEVTPLLCRRSERQNLRLDRLQKIAVSAMKQSARDHLPLVNPLTPFDQWIRAQQAARRFIGWIPEGEPERHLNAFLAPKTDAVVAIGPEGDFDPEEVAVALSCGFEAVSLGAARLRTETAGVLAVALLREGG